MKLFFKITLLTVFIALTGGYFAFVFRLSDIMVSVLADSAQMFKNAGLNFEYELVKRRFSVVPNVYLKNIRLSLQNPNKITAVEFDGAKIQFNPLRFSEVKIVLSDKLSVVTFADEYTVNFKHADLTAVFNNRQKVSEMKLKLDDAIVLSEDKKKADIGSLVLSFHNNGADDEKEEGVGIEASSNRLAVNGEYVDGFYADISLNRNFNFNKSWPDALRDYRDKGGVIVVNRMGLGWEQMRFIGNGSLFLDDKMDISAVFSTDIFGFDEGLARLEKRKLISKKERWMAKVVLYAQAKNNQNKESFIPAEIVIKGRDLYVGPVLFYKFKDTASGEPEPSER